MFKRMKDAFGVGGATVDAVLSTPSTTPGGSLEGLVHIKGGEREQDLRGLRLAFECVAERETDDGEVRINKQFGEAELSHTAPVQPGEELQLPFTIAVPWECPPNLIGGTALPGIRLGLASRLDIAGAKDAKDFDPVTVAGLPAQEATLQAFSSLGFLLKGADLEEGKAQAAHLRSTLGVYAEYEFHGQGRVREVEVTFITTEQECGVLVEVDKRGRFGVGGGDRTRSFTIPTQSADLQAITAQLHGLLA